MLRPKASYSNPANGGYYNITGPTNYHLLVLGTLPVIADGDATLSACLGGGGQLVKSGPGTLTISNENTNTGPIIVAACGQLLVESGGWYENRGIGSGSLTISNGATAEFTISHGFGGSNYGEPVTINNGTLQLDGDNYSSGLNLTAGTINVATGHYLAPISSMICTVNAAATTSVINTPSLSLQGAVTFNVARGRAVTDLAVAGGVISGTGDSITKTGARVFYRLAARPTIQARPRLPPAPCKWMARSAPIRFRSPTPPRSQAREPSTATLPFPAAARSLLAMRASGRCCSPANSP